MESGSAVVLVSNKSFLLSVIEERATWAPTGRPSSRGLPQVPTRPRTLQKTAH